MKVCINFSALTNNIKPDEIKFRYRDRKSITTFPDEPTIILDCYDIKELDWEEIKRINILTKEKLVLCVDNIKLAEEAKKHNIKWYLGYSISSYYDLNGLLALSPTYIRINGPLFFDIEKVKNKAKKFDVLIRHTPNVAFSDGLSHWPGYSGTWIHPNHLYLYEDYIDVIEFEDCDAKKEETLYNIYINQQSWPTSLSVLISNLDISPTSGIGRMITPEMTIARLKCRQICEAGGKCQICSRALAIADADRFEKLLAPAT